jgi:hypothetical protein
MIGSSWTVICSRKRRSRLRWQSLICPATADEWLFTRGQELDWRLKRFARLRLFVTGMGMANIVPLLFSAAGRWRQRWVMAGS